MKIVIDTSVLLSALFFGGFPRKVLEAVMQGKVTAYATREIVEEYEAGVAKMKSGKREKLNSNLLLPFTSRLHIVSPKPADPICRDPGDEKFISCTRAANALYIVGDDKEISFADPGASVKILTVEGLCKLLTLNV